MADLSTMSAEDQARVRAAQDLARITQQRALDAAALAIAQAQSGQPTTAPIPVVAPAPRAPAPRENRSPWETFTGALSGSPSLSVAPAPRPVPQPVLMRDESLDGQRQRVIEEGPPEGPGLLDKLGEFVSKINFPAVTIGGGSKGSSPFTITSTPAPSSSGFDPTLLVVGGAALLVVVLLATR